jgi:hypothetical protein
MPAEGEAAMTERRHESEDLEDFEVLDASDTLAGPPGDDPLDRGVATPEHWSAPIRSGEQETGESLDQQLAEEEPDFDAEDYGDEFDDLDENEPEGDIRRALLEDGPDLRAGRLVTENEDGEEFSGEDLIARDAGIDSGASTAEEAAVHVLDEEDDSGDDEP